jgi:hypothetical protein
MSGAPDFPPWLKQAIDAAQRANEIVRRSIAMQIPADVIANAARAVEQYQVMAPALERALKSVQTNQLVIDRVQELIRRYSPDNWHDLESGELDVVDLVQESGIPVIWVPRAQVIEALLAADSAARYAALVSSSADVLEDLEAALSTARDADVQGHAEAIEFANKAVAAARDGHWWAAQALAASGLGQVIHRVLEYRVFRDAYKQFSERDIEEADMTVLKAALLEVCTAKALTHTDKAQPDVFNRHGTQHGERRFFSQSSALSGLLLLVGWVREFAWLAENDLLSDDARDGWPCVAVGA